VTVEPALAPRTSTAPRVAPRLFGPKRGDRFVAANAFGDLIGVGVGLLHDDTRVPSGLRLRMGGRLWVPLGGAVGQDNVLLTANPADRPLPLPPAGRRRRRASSMSSARACSGEPGPIPVLARA
jgi:hypothetical protein